MKKIFLIAAFAFGAATANAQTVLLSTYQGTDVSKYDGQTRNVVASRHVITGWNTISLPFAVSSEKLDEIFGSDCRLEKLVGVESSGAQVQLNFMDCKAEGIQANVPYILHYSGESATKRIAVENAPLHKGNASVSFGDVNGVQVTFAAAQTQRDAKGVYGILARDNGEAAFVSVDNLNTVLYATRCYVQLSNGNSTMLTTNHIAANETTSINSVLRNGEQADVYTIAGTKVANGLGVRAISQLPAGIYVVNGKKIAVK